jgi:hypothetical protein
MGKGGWFGGVLVACLWQAAAHGQCAPAPDSAYFFRNLSENRAEAKITDNRAYFNQLLSDSFVMTGLDGRHFPRQQYIDSELGAGRTLGQSPFFSIRDYTLLEHRKGHTVASYRLIEGATEGDTTRISETWLREVYEVQDGQWRLTAIEIASGAPGTNAAR